MKNNKAFLRALRDGEGEAYRRLFDEYFKRLHRFAARMVFDADAAHDIVQAVFVNIYENSRKLSDSTNLGGLLFVSVRNGCLKYLRDHKVEDRHRLLYVQTVIDSGSLEWIDDDELVGKIVAAIERLPPQCREVAKLRLLKCMKFGDIARELSISESTAKVQARRAVHKIRESLSSDASTLVLVAAVLDIFV